MKKPVTVYLIHLDEKFGHCHHYLGATNNLTGRMYYHRKGLGSYFLAAVNQAGISYNVVKTWDASSPEYIRFSKYFLSIHHRMPSLYDFEQSLKKRSRNYLNAQCPCCKAKYAHRSLPIQPLYEYEKALQ